ncbi:fimbria/pilus outer membrane usher protein [Pantoea sp. Al-1710]|uniref:Fimbria/pilus outer membrane usher protein n=1 Tax=Candidatus Pantoea communis TaxID=2608354 RepID=A0ABX0RZ36_9GAMM|nr:fimbria/pilus outer membrane usher protein [Pantoea communis]NIG21014.1 fimbria/pilus outer membrane usher protein [Pantoea communis]
MKPSPKLKPFKISRLAIAVFGVLCSTCSTLEGAEAFTEFDVESLKAKGLPASLATEFAAAPRFMPGNSTVELKVNGEKRGRHAVQFDEKGQPCVNADFIHAAGLKTPPGMKPEESCFDLNSVWPQTEWNLDSSESRIELVVSSEAINPEAETTHWQHGGTAGLLNYEAQYSGSTGAMAGLEFMQLGTEAGFNAGDWIFRSRQTFSRFNGVDNFQHQNAYAQRTFAGLKKVMQAGQISLGNSMFGAGQVWGVQMFPEQALMGDRGGPGLVEGIADSQSVVEVRQSGALLYSTTVPAGPFRLQGFPLLNTRTDLVVTLTGSNGDKRQFIVPASALLLNGGAVAPGLSFGVGKLDQQGSGEAPMMATLSNGWMLSPGTMLNGGVFGSDPWRALGATLDAQLWKQSMLGVQLTGAQDNRHANKGVLASISFSQPVSERVTANINYTRQTIGYRELSDALVREKQSAGDRNRDQIGLGLGWSHDMLGSLSFSWARSSTFNGDAITYLRGSWSKSFGRSYVGLSLEKDSGGRQREGDMRAYLSVSIPLGNDQSTSSYLSTSKHSTRGGVRYDNRASQDRGWSLATDRDFRSQRNSGTASIDMVTPISQLSGSVSTDSDHYTSYYTRASGSLVAHGGGITPSAYKVTDTFAIAKVGKEKGVRLETPGGPAWTDSRGYAVIPSVSGFQKSTIQVDTRTLPKNVDIANGWAETEAARGAVSHLNFEVIRNRRVLATLTDANGKPMTYSTAVFNQEGQFVTVVDEKGRAFITDADNAGKMDVQSSGKTLCSFRLDLPEQAAANELFETANAICR